MLNRFPPYVFHQERYEIVNMIASCKKLAPVENLQIALFFRLR